MFLRTQETLPQQLPLRLRRALRRLRELQSYASDTTQNAWDYAASYRELRGFGLTHNDFRFLVVSGWIEHQQQLTAAGRLHRSLEAVDPLCFSKQSRFVLSSRGAALPTLPATCSTTTKPPPISPLQLSPDGGARKQARSPSQSVLATRPSWRALERELWVGDVIVKQFRWPAPNQELVLAAFEEEGWPVRIDDPLSPHLDQDPKRRLNDTVRCLNRKQLHHLIHFRSDGTGEGLFWSFTKPTSSLLQASAHHTGKGRR